MGADIRAQIAQYCNLLHEWNALYEEYAKSAGLSYTSLSVLSAIYSNPGHTQKELAEICFLPKQTVNAVVTSFLRKGWVRLEEIPEDRRNKAVNFTETGKENAAGIIGKVRDCENRAMSGLAGEQRDALLELTRMYVRSCSDAMKNE